MTIPPGIDPERDLDVNDPTPPRSEMDRFTDEELVAVYNDPDAGGVLRKCLKRILSRDPDDAQDEADEAVALLRKSFPPDTDPLFTDWQFVYAFLCAERFVKIARDRLAAGRGGPLMELSLPAIALVSPCATMLQSWRHAADAAGWKGVLPADRLYPVGQSSATPMVALKSSPIWKLLGLSGPVSAPHEPLPFPRDGKRAILVVNVGRKELSGFCAATGFPDPAPRLVAKARRLMK